MDNSNTPPPRDIDSIDRCAMLVREIKRFLLQRYAQMKILQKKTINRAAKKDIQKIALKKPIEAGPKHCGSSFRVWPWDPWVNSQVRFLSARLSCRGVILQG